jgi:hypothetical protein
LAACKEQSADGTFTRNHELITFVETEARNFKLNQVWKITGTGITAPKSHALPEIEKLVQDFPEVRLETQIEARA